MKANNRDYHLSDRLQYQKGGRQSAVPDQRRASLAAHDDPRKSHDRELTPKIGAPSGAPPIRRPRMLVLFALDVDLVLPF